MAITKNPGRQEEIVALVSAITGTGKDVDAQATFACFDVPANAIVTGGYIRNSVVTSASVKLAFGDSAVTNRYLTNIALDATGLTALTLTGFKYTTPRTLSVVISGATPATVGAFDIVLQYVVDGRAEFSQG